MGLVYLKNVVTLHLNTEKCIGCKRCIDVCPHQVFEMENSKASIANKEACMECGACAMNCPSAAINVRSGVGWAYAIIKGKLTGSEPTCDCSGDNDSCC